MRETDISSHPPETFPHSEAPDDATLKKKKKNWGKEKINVSAGSENWMGPSAPSDRQRCIVGHERSAFSLWSLAALKHEAAHCLPAELQSPDCCQNVCQKTTTAAELLHLRLLYSKRRRTERVNKEWMNE